MTTSPKHLHADAVVCKIESSQDTTGRFMQKFVSKRHRWYGKFCE